jgi:3-oxoacyl-[acyl-carrier-protein] synthase III
MDRKAKKRSDTRLSFQRVISLSKDSCREWIRTEYMSSDDLKQYVFHNSSENMMQEPEKYWSDNWLLIRPRVARNVIVYFFGEE